MNKKSKELERVECAYTKIIPLSEIKPHPTNRNKHSDAQIRALAKIIAKVGQRSPLVISNRSGVLVKGHGRLEAIKLLGWEKCAVDYQDYKTELEEFNDRIADNEIARYSEFDEGGFLDDLKQLELDIADLDMEEFGKINYSLPIGLEDFEDMEEGEEQKDIKFLLEVQFPNETEMTNVYNDMLSQGYIARIKK
jgi:hypothetical protein